MDVEFDPNVIPAERHGEIDEVLQRIAVGTAPGQRKAKPEEIRIIAMLAGGRSASEVLEPVVKRGIRNQGE